MEQSSANTARALDRAVSYIVQHSYVKTLTFVAAFLEGLVSPLPPEVLVAAIIVYRKDVSWKVLSLVSACGSAFGLSTLYFIGTYLYRSHEVFFNKLIALKTGSIAESVVTGNPFLGAFFSTFTPLLDRIFTLSAGVFGVSFLLVLVGLFFGRLLRVTVVAYCSYRFGSEARKYVLRHSRLALSIGAVLLVYVVLSHSGIL